VPRQRFLRYVRRPATAAGNLVAAVTQSFQLSDRSFCHK
jgi:hypothetical protein